MGDLAIFYGDLAGLLVLMVYILVIGGGWVFHGGELLCNGVRSVAKTPQATYWRGVIAAALGGLTFVLLMMTTAVALSSGGSLSLPWGWIALGAVLVGLIILWLFVMALFRIRFFQAIVASWKALILLGVLAVAAYLVYPQESYTGPMQAMADCKANLSSIRKAIVLYRFSHDDNWPGSIDDMIAAGLPGSTFLCPGVRPGDRQAGRKYDYFYLPPADANDDDAFVLCEYTGNHHGRTSRAVLKAAGIVIDYTEKGFQAKLAKPVNAGFAAALRQAEGSAAPPKP